MARPLHEVVFYCKDGALKGNDGVLVPCWPTPEYVSEKSSLVTECIHDGKVCKHLVMRALVKNIRSDD